MYWKEYSDPVSEAKFLAIALKTSAYNVRGRGTDFGPIYEGINPLYYSIIVTPSGLAAEEQVLKRSPRLLFRDRDALLQRLLHVREQTVWQQPRTTRLAAQAYDRAFSCAEYMKIPRSELAGMAMKASWVYRELRELEEPGAEEQVQNYRKLALDKYLDAYENEDLSQLKLGYAGVAYLIGELLRERGEFNDSLRWLSRVVTDREVGGEVKRLARNQLDLCKEQREKAKQDGTFVPPEPERTKLRSMYQLYHDQVRWLANASAEGGMNESDLLRGILDGMKRSKLDLRQFESEEQLSSYLQQQLKGKS
jgi:uncharacterized protein